MCTLKCSYPGLIFPFLISLGVTPSSLSNYIHIFSISSAIALVQKSVPDFLSISYASFTVLGTCIPKVFDVHQYLDFTLEIILSQWRKVSLIHQPKVFSSLISFAMEYSASSTGLYCLRSFIGTQSTDTSFHFTKSFQP